MCLASIPIPYDTAYPRPTSVSGTRHISNEARLVKEPLAPSRGLRAGATIRVCVFIVVSAISLKSSAIISGLPTGANSTGSAHKFDLLGLAELVSLSPPPVPLCKMRARHERNPFPSTHLRPLPSAVRAPALRFSVAPLPLHFQLAVLQIQAHLHQSQSAGRILELPVRFQHHAGKIMTNPMTNSGIHGSAALHISHERI
jgi:hypothetical protein